MNDLKTRARLIALACAMAVLTGCGGLKIKPLTKEQAEALHMKADPSNGYVVYAPMLVVEVTRGKRCMGDLNPNGECPTNTLSETCLMSAPKLFPDYDKPFLVNIEPGFGKATIDVSIADGWRLASVHSETDNTEVVKYLMGALGAKAPALAQNLKEKTSGGETVACKTGIFRWGPESMTGVAPLVTK